MQEIIIDEWINKSINPFKHDDLFGSLSLLTNPKLIKIVHTVVKEKIHPHFTLFGFNQSGVIGDVVFLKIKLVNKGQKKLHDAYFSFHTAYEWYWDWFQNKRAAGCDTLSALSYCYFTSNYDNYQYGENPPAYGIQVLQGPLIESLEDSAFYGNKWIRGYWNLRMSNFYGDFSKPGKNKFLYFPCG